MSGEIFQDELMVIAPRRGKSAYDYAVEGGYSGTEEEFAVKLAALLCDGIICSVDQNNTLVICGPLEAGSYTAYYELETPDGTKSLVEIGKLTLAEEEPEPEPTTYTITWIVDGKTTTTTVEEGVVPTFTGSTDKAADSQYTYTFKGWDKTVVAAVADAIYTAVYEQTAIETEPAEPKNFAEYNATNTTEGDTTIWVNQSRINSGGSVVAETSTTYGVAVVSNFIPVQNGDVVYYEGFYTAASSSLLCNGNKERVKNGALKTLNTDGYIADLTESTSGDRTGNFTISNADVEYIRLGGFVRTTDTPVIKIQRNGEYLTA